MLVIHMDEDPDDAPDIVVEISTLDTAWSALKTYCDNYENRFRRTTGAMKQTMTTIYALNTVDRDDAPAIHTYINDILRNLHSLGMMFNGYYDDKEHRVRLVDILNCISTHIAMPAKGRTAGVEGQHIKMSALLMQLQALVQLHNE